MMARKKAGQDKSFWSAKSSDELRLRAEELRLERIKQTPEITERASLEEAIRLNHELQVYRIVTELQDDELRRMHTELEAAHDRYFNLYDLAPVGYFLLNFNGLIMEANITFAALLGVEKRQLLQQPLTQFIFSEDQDIYSLHRKELLEMGSTPACEIRFVKTDGTPVWIRLEENLAKNDDGTTMMHGMGSDITNYKLLQAELAARNNALLEARVRERTLQLEEANRQFARASRAKSAFLANMSHELRTPLNAILGFSEVIQDQLFGPLNEKQKKYIADILTSGKHLLSLINDVLDLSKVEAGKMELDLRPVKLSRICGEIASLLRERSHDKGLSLHCSADVATDEAIMGDERKLKQVLFNLVDNGIKYNRAGGSVWVRVDRLDNAAGDYWRVVVEDNGVGIAAEDISKLFQPFSQLSNIDTELSEGTGLGLALTKRLVELHGGEIHVESELGKGSRFIVLIPSKIKG